MKKRLSRLEATLRHRYYASQLESVGHNVTFGGWRITVFGGHSGTSRGIRIADDCTIYDNCQLYCDAWPGSGISLGRGTSVNFGCYLCGSGGLTIGEGTLIGPGVCIIPANHNFDDPLMAIAKQGHTLAAVVIGSDVWLGARSVVLPGISIGNGAIVGAGSVVTRDVLPNAVVAGNPARQLRFRGERR